MLNKIKELSKKTKVILLAVCLIVIAGVGSVITACTMVKSDTDTSDDKVVATESATEPTEQATEVTTELPTEEETEEPTEQATENPTEEVTEQPTEKSTEKTTDKAEEKEEATIVQTTTTIVGDNQTNSNNNSNNNTTNNTNTGTATQSKPVNNDNPNNTTTTPSKVWHEAEYKTVHHPDETKKVWVVDQEGYTYEEPIYEEHDRTICNYCETDITDNCMEHLKQHAKDRIPASYRNQWIEIQVGTKTITVEEKGHWETQVVKEAWDEQVLIKEAGYY